MTTKTETITRTYYCIDDAKYLSLRELRKEHPYIIFSNKADEETLKTVGISISVEETQIEVEVPDEEAEEQAEVSAE